MMLFERDSLLAPAHCSGGLGSVVKVTGIVSGRCEPRSSAAFDSLQWNVVQ